MEQPVTDSGAHIRSDQTILIGQLHHLLSHHIAKRQVYLSPSARQSDEAIVCPGTSLYT